MVNFPKIEGQEQVVSRNLSPVEYLTFCDFCIKNNPRISPETCMDRKSGEEAIVEPFRL